jgi:hypothetical protein
MSRTRTTRWVIVAGFTAAIALARLGQPGSAAASPQSGTAPGIALGVRDERGFWIQPGRGAHFVRAGSMAADGRSARDGGTTRLAWAGRAPVAPTPARRATARSYSGPEPRRTIPTDVPDSAANGSSDPGSRVVDGHANDYRQRKRLPDTRAALDRSQHDRLPAAGSRAAARTVRSTAEGAVFHDAHAPPAPARSLVGRLS